MRSPYDVGRLTLKMSRFAQFRIRTMGIELHARTHHP